MSFDELSPPEILVANADLHIGEVETSLEFLRAIYADTTQPISRRIRCAVAALPFEHPKLQVTASIGANSDFAARLENAIAHSRRIIEGSLAKPDDVG